MFFAVSVVFAVVIAFLPGVSPHSSVRFVAFADGIKSLLCLALREKSRSGIFRNTHAIPSVHDDPVLAFALGFVERRVYPADEALRRFIHQVNAASDADGNAR